MIEFREIELQDKQIIDKYLINNPYRASESCFSNLYGWAYKYNTKFAVWRDYLLIKFTSDRGGCSYLTPFGKGNFTSAIEALVDECGCPIKFEMSGVTEAMRQEIEKAMPGLPEKHRHTGHRYRLGISGPVRGCNLRVQKLQNGLY